jgi:quercetin dioxygenase-like cupin family protein
MDKTAFEADLARDGFGEIATRSLPAGFSTQEHFHGWDARLLILDGEFSLTRGGAVERFGPGQFCMVSAGTLHSEATGPAGASYVVGRRY